MNRPTALLIDDDADLARELRSILTDDGFDVHWVANGDLGLAYAKARRPRLLCLDLTLPRLSGFDVCESVRSDPDLAQTSIVVVSARDTPLVRAQAHDCGADAYVAKPFSRADLLQEIARVVRGRATISKLAAPRATMIDSLLRVARIRRA